MIGRAAYNTPWILTDIDPAFGQPAAASNRADVVAEMVAYLASVQAADRTAKALIRHMMGLYAGQPGARLWRRSLSDGLVAKQPPATILERALSVMQNRQAA